MFDINSLSDRALEIAAETLYDASHASYGTEHRYRRLDEIEAADMVKTDRKDIDDVYALLVCTLRDRRENRRQALTDDQASPKL